MAHLNTPINGLQAKAEQTVRQAGPWVERLARLGYAAKGIVYITIGILAVQAAFFGSGRMTNQQGALSAIVHQPFGQFLLALVGIGLAGYALWRFVEAGIDAENRGSDAKGWITRIGHALSGVTYAVLAYTAFQLVTGAAHANNGNSSMQDWTARLLAMPFGQGLVALLGLVIIGLGVGQFIKGYKADLDKQLMLQEISPSWRQWAVLSGRLGYAARGVVFAIIGGFFVEAALHTDPKQAKGLGSALDLLVEQSYGPWLMGLVAVGLAAYGVFMLVEAQYRRIEI